MKQTRKLTRSKSHRIAKRAKSILVFNVGSSSIKHALFANSTLIRSTQIDRVYSATARYKAVEALIKELRADKIRIDAIAHRIVHGADITKPTRITPTFLKQLKKIAVLAPLHDFAEIQVIEQCRKMQVPQIAIFDTAFHTTMPKVVSTYAIPLKYRKIGIKKYGFHGISHQYVTQGMRGRVISCHLGNGCSVTAIKDGKSVANSMGFTPMEGLVMGTRCGSIDPGVILHILSTTKMSEEKLRSELNSQSGLKAISNISSDMRDLLKSKNKNAKFAIDLFVHHVVKTIASYIPLLGGVDTIVFTGGIGQNAPVVRRLILKQLSFLNVKIDTAANNANARVFSTKKSKVKLLCVPTNEEKAIAEICLKYK